MVAIAQFELGLDAVPLRRLFERHPEATVELERVIPLQNRVVPYFWVTGAEGLHVDDGFDPDRGIERLKLVDEIGGRSLVRIERATDHDGLAEAIERSEVTLLSAVGTSQGWRMEVRGDDRETIARFHETCSERGIEMRLDTLHRLESESHDDGSSLTDSQREALLLAYERGYYDSPRTTNLSDLGEFLGISRQAVSNRLKRGTRQLIEETLVRRD
jgi:predicted DNA binding protein